MTRKVRHIVVGILRYVGATLALSVLLYVALALFFSTEEEHRLERENALYKELYGEFKERNV